MTDPDSYQCQRICTHNAITIKRRNYHFIDFILHTNKYAHSVHVHAHAQSCFAYTHIQAQVFIFAYAAAAAAD